MNHALTKGDLIAFEKGIAAMFDAGAIRAPVHLAGGNEAALQEIFAEIRPQDWITCTWRSHYHCLLKGVPPERLRADIVAGRSIALCYPEHRIISSAIVGGALPVAVGIAWAIKRSGEDARVWAFSGDMAATTGMFHECVQYAAGHHLPIQFVVESNGKSVCTDTAAVWGNECQPSRMADKFFEYVLPWPHSGAGKRVQF